MPWLYAALLAVSIFFPLLFSGLGKPAYRSRLGLVLLAAALGSIPFLIWDVWFTEVGYWGFNPRYVFGLYLGPLPLEEVLFFLLIPLASLYFYHLIHSDTWLFRSTKNLPRLAWRLLAWGLAVGALGLAWWWQAQTYTAVLFGFGAFSLGVFGWRMHPQVARDFLLGFVMVVPFFFLINGILTGSFLPEPVVWYAPEAFSGIRMGTIPVEDLGFGFLMLAWDVFWLEWLVAKRSAVG